MEIFFLLCGAVLVGSLIHAIAARALFLLRWHMFGWRPDILDQELVDKCVEECADYSLNYVVKDSTENHGYTPTEDEKESYYALAKTSYRSVIENYIMQFSMFNR